MSQSPSEPWGRRLEDDQSVWDENSWDDVEWTPERAEEAERKIAKQIEDAPLLNEEGVVQRLLNEVASECWDRFYSNHDRWFFKDRQWLLREFPTLIDASLILEVGCGVGNTIFPLFRDRRAVSKSSLNHQECPKNSNVTIELTEDEIKISSDGLCHSSDHDVAEVVSNDHKTFLPNRCVCEYQEKVSNQLPIASKNQIGLDTQSENLPKDLSITKNQVNVGDGKKLSWPSRGTDTTQSTHAPKIEIFACDFSETAINLLKNFREYDPVHMHAFVYDITNPVLPDVLQTAAGTIDVILAVFVLSAVDPEKLKNILQRLFTLLKPGTGTLMIRDYGRYDLTQLRFKPTRLLRPDLYVRGDGTAVHYFTSEEIENLANITGFIIDRNTVYRRLLVNRHRRLTMYRVWVQAILRRPSSSP